MEAPAAKKKGVRDRATLKEVARDVGVSVCTVSVVLNKTRSTTIVSETTRKAVTEAAERLGYRPNRIARSLHSGRTNSLGVVPASSDRNIILGPHLQHVLNGVVNAAESYGYDVTLITRCDQSRIPELLDGLLDGRLDGVVIVAPRDDSRLIETLSREPIPFAVIDGDQCVHNPSFQVNNAESVRDVVRHLVELGHARIGHIAGTQALPAARERLEAFRSCLQEAGLPVKEDWIRFGNFEPPSGEAALRRMMQSHDRPTAVFCANDEMALGAYGAAIQMGLSIPRELSIVGFDDSPNSTFSHPPLTTVAHPIGEIARRAASSLIEFIQTGKPMQSHSLPGTLVVRSSTAKPMEVLP